MKMHTKFSSVNLWGRGSLWDFDASVGYNIKIDLKTETVN